ncbi:MAG TPA: hypothetical protein VGI44_10300, partial [Acidimicrobiales bacterium]
MRMADRCVDIFSRPDGTFGFEEFRRDPEDMGGMDPGCLFLQPRVPDRRRYLHFRQRRRSLSRPGTRSLIPPWPTDPD